MSQWGGVVAVSNNNRNTNNNDNDYTNSANSRAVSTAVRHGNGYDTSSARLQSPRTAVANKNGLIDANGVGPARGVIVTLAGSNPAKLGTSMALTTSENASTYLSLVTSDGIDSTFWKPNAATNERGLLEAIHRRGTSSGKDILVSSRPVRELECNFSTPDDRLFNVNSDLYKLSHTTRAVRGLNRMPNEGTVEIREVKDGLRRTLPSMTEDAFHLCKYRDYSDWAVRHYWKEAKRDGLLGKKYVEKYFALCVGANPGTLIPISEEQMINGHEQLIHKAATAADEEDDDGHSGNAAAAQNGGEPVLKSFALNATEYAALGPNREAEATDAKTGHYNGQAGAAGGAYPYDYPSAWDWSPAAINRRVGFYLEQKYKALGRFIVKSLIVVSVGYVVVGYLKSGGGNNNRQNNGGNNGGDNMPRSRWARHQARMAQQNNGNYNNSNNGGGYDSFSMFSMMTNPKAAFDYMLAPAK